MSALHFQLISDQRAARERFARRQAWLRRIGAWSVTALLLGAECALIAYVLAGLLSP